jgi:hypothetical protein
VCAPTTARRSPSFAPAATFGTLGTTTSGARLRPFRIRAFDSGWPFATTAGSSTTSFLAGFVETAVWKNAPLVLALTC